MQTKKRGVLVWHRRSGKDKTCWNFLIKEAAKRVGVYFYFFPTYGQGKKVIWDNIDKQGFKLINHIPKELMSTNPNNTEMKIRLINGSIIQIVGTNDIDSIVGTNPVGCIFSEFSLQDPKVWSFIRPILRENGGWAVFNGTPRGANHFKELFDMASFNQDWFVQRLTVDDTKCISKEDIQKERDEGMSEDMIQQEYYTSFTLGVEGSYYAKYLQDARDEDRIGHVPWARQSRVYTAWDLGYGDSTAIIFYQVIGKEVHIIDYYENHGEGLPHYAEVLFRKPYLYADHYAPHDIESRGFSTGMSGRDVGASLGIKFTTLPTLQIRIEDGIEAARGIFPRIYVDEANCKHLIKCLENYRKEFDTRLEVYKSRPRHDKFSHGADAFRYLAIAVKRFVDSKGGPTDDEVDALLNKYQPVFN